MHSFICSPMELSWFLLSPLRRLFFVGPSAWIFCHLDLLLFFFSLLQGDRLAPLTSRQNRDKTIRHRLSPLSIPSSGEREGGNVSKRGGFFFLFFWDTSINEWRNAGSPDRSRPSGDGNLGGPVVRDSDGFARNRTGASTYLFFCPIAIADRISRRYLPSALAWNQPERFRAEFETFLIVSRRIRFMLSITD